MDTILVINAGSSSVKFQVFAVDGDGRLQRQIKGQMDGIGSRPRLRASGASGEKLAERVYPIEAVGDVRRKSILHGFRPQPGRVVRRAGWNQECLVDAAVFLIPRHNLDAKNLADPRKLGLVV